MPFFSIVIPAYNNDEFLPGCLESVLAQSFADWEAVVVVDGSPDRCGAIAKDYASRDPRVKVIDKKRNEGVHLARTSGVEASSGQFIYLLDADDAIPAEALQQLHDALEGADADMLHFGISVVGVDVDEGERRLFESYINKKVETLEGADICAAAFSPEMGYLQDWRVTQRVYSADLLKSAYDVMVKERLGRAQDGYEYFVISTLAQKQVTIADLVALSYYYGRGVNSAAALGVEKFIKSAQDFQAAIDAIMSYQSSLPGNAFATEARGAADKLVQLLMNDWHARLSDEDKIAVIPDLADIIGRDYLSIELMRFVRDDAYALWCGGGTLDGSSPLWEWFEVARELREGLPQSGEYDAMEAGAERHLQDNYTRFKAWEGYAKQPVRIFVSTHKPAQFFESDILQPVQVGAVRSGNTPIGCAFMDSTGDNISHLNPMYCELTTQYWAWKNCDAEYYGFCHYRRYFDFGSERHEENAWGEIMWPYIDEKSQREFGLDDENIARAIEGYDVITTEFKDLRDFPADYETPLEHYDAAPHLRIEDLERTMDILKEMHPDYAEDVDEFLNGNTSCFCNMFIMRKKIFQDYCAWLFPILQRFMDETDMSHYDKEMLRTPGHLSERLLNIFYRHHMRIGAGWKTKQVQCVHFVHPEPKKELAPASPEDGRHVIPVVLAADDNYVPMLTTTIYSFLKNASRSYFYDVIVFERNIMPSRKAMMQEFFSVFDYARVRFVDVGASIEKYNLVTNNEHISLETYYRFLIQGLLPFYDKVVYLDSDLVVEGDIAELYRTKMGDSLIAGVVDVDFLGNLNMKHGDRMDYAREVLKLSNPYGYFQAGVLVLNTKKLRAFKDVDEWLRIASDSTFIYDDQDILNAFCQDRVTYLDNAWNVMNDCGGRIANVFSFAPAEVYDAYLAARKQPKVVHYAGFEKPWKTYRCDESERYWKYARETPFYEELLSLLSGPVVPPPGPVLPPRAMGENNPLRRVVDPFMPPGSRRRELAKSVGRALRGR